MKVLLTTLNAKYYHSCLALRCLAAFCAPYAPHFKLMEFTVNNAEGAVLRALFSEKPDVVCFSCYIWNIRATLSLINSLKKILPRTAVIVGGPEVSHRLEALVAEHPVDAAVRGEGEWPFARLMDHYIAGRGALSQIPGVTFRDKDGCVVSVEPGPPADLDAFPFPYRNGLAGLEHKIIYYETSRGCPYRCAYCLSGGAEGVRFRSETLCLDELGFFLDQRVRQVKLVDRTFNCNKAHAMAIWRFLAERDNGVTNFHFEMAGDLMDDDMLSLFSGVRDGLFQFEIGVQSTNAAALAAVGRRQNLKKLFENVKTVAGFGNIHQHLDLIAGLPGEDITSFAASFNAVYGAAPQQLQLGFLKLLHGSELRLRAEELGIVYRPHPPYEVLFTKDLPVEDMFRLKTIEEMVEMVYNSNMCKAALSFSVPRFPSPFHFYDGLARHFQDKGYADAAHSRAKLYDIMYEYLSLSLPDQAPVIGELLTFDMLLNERAAHLPGWAAPPPTDGEKRRIRRAIRAFPGNGGGTFNRKLHIQKFNHDVAAWMNGLADDVYRRESFVLFDYTKGKPGFAHIEI